MERKCKSGFCSNCGASIAKKSVNSQLEWCLDKFNGTCRLFLAFYNAQHVYEAIKALIEAYMRSS